jgi:hypothetical protein
MTTLKRKSQLDDAFDLEEPWKAKVTSFSAEYSSIGFDLDYRSDAMTCPICSRDARIADRKVVTLDLPEMFFGVSTRMTAYLPVLERHNTQCPAEHEPQAVSNTLLLDIIIKQIGPSGGHNPLRYLFNAVAIS